MTTAHPRRSLRPSRVRNGALALLLAATGIVSATRADAAVTCFGLAPTKVGTPGSELILGTGGDDVIYADGGNDTILGRGGNDRICGGPGSDTISGGNGNDQISGAINGGADNAADTLTYAFFIAPVTVDLAAGTATGEGNDTFSGMDHAVGTNAADTLVGTVGKNRLSGRGGNDILRGAGGDDELDGGDDRDTVLLGAASTVDLALGTATGEGNDTLIAMENVTGSPGDDTIRGDDALNVLKGMDGNDTLRGRGGDDDLFGVAGNDTLDGGDGQDRLLDGAGNDAIDGGPGVADTFFATDMPPVGVTVNLATGTASNGGTDTITGVEQLFGGGGDDTLIGDGGPNIIIGGNGNDTLRGAGGRDNVLGQEGNDTMVGGAGPDTLQGGAGDDSMAGGNGDDTVQYVDATQGVAISIFNDRAVGFGTDTFTSIENAVGSLFNDAISGSSGPNFIDGNDGIDACSGFGGADIIIRCE